MGGMAEIFRGKSIGAEGFEKVVAIKRILPHFSEDEGFVTMFKDEARVAAQLTHANVVQVFDFDEVDELFYIAMEYVEGHDLKRVLDVGAKVGKPLSIAQSVHIMMEASQGLHYAHTRVVDGQPLNIIHRDVSPHNIMVSFNGEVKIMDFGIAKAASRSTKTRVGTVKGKCAYMSPEQARGKPLDARSDLFALGVTLWEMLTGKRLFVGESDFETLNNVLKAEVPPLSELNPEVPKDLDAIVLRALARDRDDRQADVGQFVSELRRWFYGNVPDPEAANIKNYMNDLFADDIAKLRNDVAAEQQMMESVRKGGTSSQRRAAGTGSSPAAKIAPDDERTMALDTAMAGPADSDRTMALPDAMAQLGLANARGGTAGGRTMADMPAAAPKQSKAGLFIGVGVVIAAIAGAGGYIAINNGKTTTTQQAGIAAPGVAGAEGAKAKKVQLVIKAAGANRIDVNDNPLCTQDECAYSGEVGTEVKITARNGDRLKISHHVLEKDETIVLELPKAEEKKPEPAAAVAQVASPVVIVQVSPQNAEVTVNGQKIELSGGNGKVPNAKLGDTIKVEAKAEGHKSETKDFLVKNPQLETFEIKLEREQKDKPAGGQAAQAPSGPGKLVVNAKPWAKVSEKGKDLGLTPVKVDLPAGKHTLTLTKGTVVKTVTISIKPGQTATSNVDMTGEAP
jgi:hypothetical protein